MKLYNAKLGKVIDATPIMFKSLAIKGWVIVPEDEPQTAINDEVESDKPYPYEDIKEDFSSDEEHKPKADPVKKVKAKSKNKK